MYDRVRPLVLTVLLLALSANAAAANFGVAPPTRDLGTVEPGETLTGTIYVTTDREELFAVKPKVYEGKPSSIYGANNEQINVTEYSDADVTGWFTFPGSLRIDPSAYQPPEGVPDDVDGVVEYEIQVPSDADVGYHSAEISINPQTGAEGGGTGAVVRAVARQEVYFRTTGTAQRDISIGGARAFRTGEDQVRIDVLFQNQGTTTTTIGDGTIEVRDNSGNLVTDFSVDRITLGPGERYYQTITWEGNTVGAGTYQLSVSADYRTDTAFGEETISVPQAVEIVPQEQRNPNQNLNQDGGDDGVPFWLVALALVLTGVLLYAFEVDPTWILIVIGGLGIVSFILMSGVPNMMVVVMAVLGATAYYLI